MQKRRGDWAWDVSDWDDNTEGILEKWKPVTVNIVDNVPLVHMKVDDGLL